IGANMISQVSADPFLANITLISFILGFYGFSIQAQVGSIIAKSDIRFSTYFFARLLHGAVASMLTVLLYGSLYLNRQVVDFDIDDIPVYLPDAVSSWAYTLHILKQVGPLITILSLGICTLILSKRLIKIN